MKRRDLLQYSLGYWVTPIIISVPLPAHAIVSECSASKIIGAWVISGNNSGIILKENGITDDGRHGGKWSISGIQIQISYDGHDFLIRGELMNNCTKIIGTEYSFESGMERNVTLVKL